MTSAISNREELDPSVGSTDDVRGVAFLCHPYHRGGVTRWMVDAATEFANRGVPTWFVTPEPRRPFRSGGGRPSMASLVRRGAEQKGARLVAQSVGTTFELGTRAYRTAVYAHAVLSGVPLGTPVIVSDDDDVWAAASSLSAAYPMIGVLHADDPKYYRLASTYSPVLAACVAVSKRIARKAQHNVGFPIVAIPCGVPIPAIGQREESYSDCARLIWVGRLEEEQKRVSDLPRIAAGLRERGVRFVLDIIGDGPERSWLQREVERFSLQSDVRLSGWLSTEAIWERMRSSDVLVLPSNYEGMPVVVMEALAGGCAVVASRVSGVEDAAEEPLAREVLFAHDVGDTDTAVTQVIDALAIPRQERRRSARTAAERLFAIEVCIARYADIVRRAGASRPISAPRRPSTILSGAVSLPLAYARSARRALTLRRRNAQAA